MKTIRRIGLTPFAYALLACVALWAMIGLCAKTAFGADPLAWDRTYPVGDSILVPVRWNAACDLRGCAESYRVTWTLRTAPLTDDNKATAPRTNTAVAQTDVVIRETTVTTLRDFALIPSPEVAQPRTVCVSVVSLRRGLASTAQSACRTVEAPDAPPPPVDSIRWDTLGVSVNPKLRDSLGDLTVMTLAAYQYRVRDSTYALDSLPVVRGVARPDTMAAAWLAMRTAALEEVVFPDSSVASRAYTLELGYNAVPCAVTPHRFAENTVVVSIPNNGALSAPRIARYRERCRTGVQLDYPMTTSVRFHAEPVTQWVSDTMSVVPRGEEALARALTPPRSAND